ncbi:MAG TPA: GNAT family N-acyltransferase [Gemmatimonadales bacterium]|nr:GNAT family N-acyltransferase [Gemmatimonadales bacterium]
MDGALLTFPAEPRALPPDVIEAGRYVVRFARTEAELDRLLRLRFEVFNLELQEGLDEAHCTGRDEDQFDRSFHHLAISLRETGETVGTYRMQTGEMAAAGAGFYSAGLFALESLPPDVRRAAIEIGRACVAREHRNGRVLHLLWRGLAAYLLWNRKTTLFGCCSLTSQDPALGTSVHRHLEAIGAVHGSCRVLPRPEHACEPVEDGNLPPPHVPALFQAYLSLGAKVLGPPAIDRAFKTIDWLVLLDVEELAPAVYRGFFG